MDPRVPGTWRRCGTEGVRLGLWGQTRLRTRRLREEVALLWRCARIYPKYKKPMKLIISNDTILEIFFLAQKGTGFIGNTWLLTLHACTFLFQPHQKKPLDLIIAHLTFANATTMIIIGIPEIMLSFGMRNFMDDIGCKAVLYTHRVSRGLSLCTTSFLSVFQAIIIIPNNSRWAWLKPKISINVLDAFVFFWIINMLIYIPVIGTTVAPYNTTENGSFYSLTYCRGRETDRTRVSAFVVVMVLRDFLCVFLMVSASVYMVLLLFRHRKSVQHVRKVSLCPRASPEIKATHSILALVSCFVFFYWTNCCLTIYVSYRHNIQGMENVDIFISSCYPLMCPFLLIKNNNRLSCLKCTFLKKRKSSRPSISLKGLK
ncbi:vomeronasal type-1 receptor 4-like [Dasypus novemcinctus]|uniref:vomeronasal type-1 receptor 4-like n=1 Tax=Dasypus novemcinctus TaxID=9361 RepID=UPI00265E7157|nr:vomeronasal type-1 receptor 4-like [Dasypus novemcinctus]